ncbi:rhodanese-like domain-containing protein [Rathayibacter sp. CAU 1779]
MTLEPGASIPAGDAIALTESESVWLLDVREHHEWNAGHAPGAHHIPIGELGLRQDELPDDGTVIAVMCHLGYRSRQVTDALVRADYPAVDIDGGLVAWQASGGDVVMDGPEPGR